MLTMVAADQMQEVQARIVGSGLEVRPCFCVLGFHQIAPEFVDHFDAQRDVAHHFAGKGKGLRETMLRIGVFPKLAAIVKQHAGKHQVAIELRVHTANRIGRAHHLRDMFDESATTSMVVFARRRRAPKAVAHLIEKHPAQRVQARLGNARAETLDHHEIRLLTPTQVGIAGIKIIKRSLIRHMKFEILGVHAIGALRPACLEPQHRRFLERLRFLIDRRIRPKLEGHFPGRVGKGHFEIRLAGLGYAG